MAYYYYMDPSAPQYYYYGPAPYAPYYYPYQPAQFGDNEPEEDKPESPQHYEDRGEYDTDRQAQLEWATENPVRLRVSLHCEGCCWKLDEDLRNLRGVYDVSISGWSDGMVTVTGMASKEEVLRRARASARNAEFW